jgi:hypothetical protein
MTGRELYIITLRPEEPHVAGLRALRAALKTLLRRFGLRCTRVEIVLPGDPLLLKQPGPRDVANTILGHTE